MNTFPLNFGPDGAGDGRFHRTASGDWIPGGVWQFKGYDEKVASISERKTAQGVVWCCRDFFLGHDGEHMIPICSKIGHGITSRNW